MRKNVKSEKGLSLVEATIMLLVLSVLTSVLAPSILDYINDAREMKVKEDVEAIGISIGRLLRDSRESCLLLDANNGTGVCSKANRVDILYSDGAEPVSADANRYVIENSAITGTNLNWFGAATGADETAQGDTMERHLVQNQPGGDPVKRYADPTASGGGPKSGIGWRGAYMAAPVGPDPWGQMYQANTAFLNVATNVAGTGTGQTSGIWKYDTFVISAGRDGIISTKVADHTIGSGGTVVVNDDVIYVISGASR